MLKTIGEKIAEEMENSLSRKILKELEARPVENSLLIFDMLYEKPERLEVYAIDPKNLLMLWKCFELPDATIIAESEKKVEKLLGFVEDAKCTFMIPQNLSGPLEKRDDLKKENWLLYTTDKEKFRGSIIHPVEELEPSLRNSKQIANQWKYYKGADFIYEKMNQNPFFGIKVNERLVSYAGIFARTDNVYFSGFARTNRNFRRKGMMSSVTSALAERSFKDGKVPAMYIVEENIPSRKAVEKLGFYSIATHARFNPV